MSRKLSLIALALAAAAVAASIAQANTAGGVPAKVDPLAVGYLMGRGLSPSEVQSWTVGACSQATKPASCFAVLNRKTTPATVDPLAVGYLTGRGLSPSEVNAWTVGICSHPTKPSVCYAALERTAAAAATPTRIVQPGGFDWADAGIGAGMALGITLLLAGMGASLLIARQNRRREARA